MRKDGMWSSHEPFEELAAFSMTGPTARKVEPGALWSNIKSPRPLKMTSPRSLATALLIEARRMFPRHV
jgi:hypothetical protein